jgi:4-diphosphocytidyl-2-C-methyl-D-erythritol kinase
LTAIPSAVLGLVLVNPRFPVSTADTYGRVTPAMYSDGNRSRVMAEALGRRGVGRVAASLYNGLELAVRDGYAQIGQMEAALMAAGALGAIMSGSGPTVFGVARSWEQARQIRGRVARGAWECWAVRTLRGPAIRLRLEGSRGTLQGS